MGLSWVEQVEESEGPAGYLHDEEESYAEAEGGFFGHFGRGLWMICCAVGGVYWRDGKCGVVIIVVVIVVVLSGCK